MALPRIESYALPTEAEIPAPRVDWAPEPGRTALLIHDMQRYFIRAFPAGEAPIAPAIANILALRQRADALGIPVFYSAQPGAQDLYDRGLQAAFWGPGMGADPEQQGIVEPLAPGPDHLLLTKWRYSAFQRTNLAPMLQARGRDRLVVTGVYAHIGCMLTAADAFMRDVRPFLVADAVADFSPEHHNFAVGYVATRCGVALSARALLQHWGGA